MTLSREARIILAILAVALAAFVWVNFYNRSGGFGGLFSTPQRSSSPAPVTPDITLPAPQGATGAEGASALDAPAVAPTSAPNVARDIKIAELPFLVTAPAPQSSASAPAGETQAESTSPEPARRVSVNPFSPIIVAQAAAAPAPQPRADVRVVDVPSGPPAVAAARPGLRPVRAPAPTAVVPNGAVLADLPRALPGGTLPVATDVIRVARTAPDNIPGVDMTEAAPDESSVAVADGAPSSPEPEEGQPVGSSSAPLVAGTSPLSRYLRNNNVVFTGSVLGPVGVGVFRSSQSPTPVVVALGQTLPNTSIVLTSLKGQQAVLTHENQSQTLILDLRR